MSDASILNLPFEVNPKRINATIGAIAFLLPVSLFLLASLSPTTCAMYSISHFYYTRIGGDILVGALAVVGAVMVLFYVYKGDDAPGNEAHNRRNALLAKAAGLFGLGVAFIPTGGVGCDYPASEGFDVSRFFVLNTVIDGEGVVGGEKSFDFWLSFGHWSAPEEVPFLLAHAHYISAAGMFAILAYFSLRVFTRVQTPAATRSHTLVGEKTSAKRTRNAIYTGMGWLMLLAMGALAVKMGVANWTEGGAAFEARWNAARLTFWCEAVALMAFGVSWAVKGRIFGLLEDQAPS
ncbi:hypothetical protein [Vannielia litorea]|uniref:Uncharacterized protein n=1 Tax=Vannielia litorea TaxID=1217970 RepID=A0A1N6EH11_9RHOB|nr:hypothetical protein [Vannielia litorea]SIN82309.1 hypothetical protein SAMN05444002_0771 [Vannielia litorea]